MVKPPLHIFFIVGRIRSGTTLLARMLNNHPAIFLPQESPFIMNLYQKHAKVKEWHKKQILAFYNDLWKEVRLTQYWKLHEQKEALKADLLALAGKANFADLSKAVIYRRACMRERGAACMMGDKNPSYALYVDDLVKAFPNAPIILLVRDARDNILSCQRVSFDFNDPIVLAERWRFFNKEVLAAHKRHPQQTILVRFEDILAQPEKTLQKICTHLGLQFEPAMLEFYKKEEHLKLESWKNFYSRPLEKSKISKWKEKMPAQEIQYAELINKKLLQRLGYEVTNQHFPASSYFKIIPGVLLAKAANWLEQYIYYIPVNIRVTIINTYRRITKTLK